MSVRQRGVTTGVWCRYLLKPETKKPERRDNNARASPGQSRKETKPIPAARTTGRCKRDDWAARRRWGAGRALLPRHSVRTAAEARREREKRRRRRAKKKSHVKQQGEPGGRKGREQAAAVSSPGG